tara:strand:+ start:880 stop:1920 length:1041 start_codon:yes stop_codon:yes gene_type:complete
MVKKNQKGSGCGYPGTLHKPSAVSKGNCDVPKADCLTHPERSTQQLGRNPFNDPPTGSENAFESRQCCGYNEAGAGTPNIANVPLSSGNALQNGGGNSATITTISKMFKNCPKTLKNTKIFVFNNRYSTEGLNNNNAKLLKKLIKQKFKVNAKTENYSTGGTKVYFDLKMNGGGGANSSGYYLGIGNKTIGGLSEVSKYDSCCQPLFPGKLTGKIGGGKNKNISNKYRMNKKSIRKNRNGKKLSKKNSRRQRGGKQSVSSYISLDNRDTSAMRYGAPGYGKNWSTGVGLNSSNLKGGSKKKKTSRKSKSSKKHRGGFIRDGSIQYFTTQCKTCNQPLPKDQQIQKH